MSIQIKQAFDYMRFGTAGFAVANDQNGREIVRTTKGIDTLWFGCRCFENGNYKGSLDGIEAVEWLMQ